MLAICEILLTTRVGEGCKADAARGRRRACPGLLLIQVLLWAQGTRPSIGRCRGARGGVVRVGCVGVGCRGRRGERGVGRNEGGKGCCMAVGGYGRRAVEEDPLARLRGKHCGHCAVRWVKQ